MTKMFLSEAEEIGTIFVSEDEEDLRVQAEEALEGEGLAVVGGALLSKGRLGGVDPTWVPLLAPRDGVTLVEADGSRRRPLKGTAAHEPLLPEGATLVVAVGGIQALGEPLTDERVHRPEVFSELTGVRPGHTIHANAFAQALLAALWNTPDGARKAALLAGVEPGRSMSDASVVAHALWREGIHNVVMTSLPHQNPGQVWSL